MKKLLLCIMIIGIATPSLAFRPDRISHFGTSAGWGLAFGSATYHLSETMGPLARTATSTGLAVLPGLAVEIGDEFSGHGFSGDDLYADALGALTGAIAAELINGQFWLSASGNQIRLIGKW